MAERLKLNKSPDRAVIPKHGVGMLYPLRPGEKIGRQKGTPNKITRRLKEAIIEASERLGRIEYEPVYDKKGHWVRDVPKETGKEGAIGYLMSLGLHHPQVFGPLLGKVLPMQMIEDLNDRDSGEIRYLSIKEVTTTLIERGIPLPPGLPNVIEHDAEEA